MTADDGTMVITDARALDQLRFSEGLIPVIAQHAVTGEVLMLGYANRAALENTLRDDVLWFYSRSRQQLWRKGDTSGNILRVTSLHADCDRDALVALVRPEGPACHTGARSCFGATPTLVALADTINQRATERSADSYTAKLFANPNLRVKKLGEEAVELALACASGDVEAIAGEGADLLYHTLVACVAAGAGVEDVLAVLERRRSRPVAATDQEAVDKQENDSAQDGDAE